MKRSVVLAAGAALVFAAGTGAVASATEPVPSVVDRQGGVLVGWGQTVDGQPWIQRVKRSGAFSMLWINFPGEGGVENSWSSGLNFRAKRPFVLDFSDGWGGSAVSGATTSRVHSLRFVLTDDRPSVVVRPRKAPRHVRRRFRFLEGYRFFVKSFRGGRPNVIRSVSARDGAGRLLRRRVYPDGLAPAAPAP